MRPINAAAYALRRDGQLPKTFSFLTQKLCTKVGKRSTRAGKTGPSRNAFSSEAALRPASVRRASEKAFCLRSATALSGVDD